MRKNYSFLSNSYSLVGVIISKINIFLSKQIFPMHITIIKIINHKNLIHLSLKFKNILFLMKYNCMSKIFPKIDLKF